MSTRDIFTLLYILTTMNTGSGLLCTLCDAGLNHVYSNATGC